MIISTKYKIVSRSSNVNPVINLPVIKPCEHLGSPLTGKQRETAGLDHARDWRYCEHPTQPMGDIVCRCKGCGPTCRGYNASIDN
jgi:hypothetical protein